MLYAEDLDPLQAFLLCPPGFGFERDWVVVGDELSRCCIVDIWGFCESVILYCQAFPWYCLAFGIENSIGDEFGKLQ